MPMPQRARVCEGVAVAEDREERTAAAWATFDDHKEADAAVPGGNRRAAQEQFSRT
jgi:hypothetical protein